MAAAEPEKTSAPAAVPIESPAADGRQPAAEGSSHAAPPVVTTPAPIRSTPDPHTPDHHAPDHEASAQKTPNRRRWLLMAGVGAWLLAMILYFGGPAIFRAWNTVSTDDAYVDGHVTFVAPRVVGQVSRVLVDDNNRVRRGDLLVELDPEPYQVQVNLRKAAVDLAKADVLAAEDQVRGLVALARSNRFKLENAIENVDNQISLLRATVAAFQTAQARLALAKSNFARAKEVAKTPGAISPQDIDERESAFRVADAQVQQALESVYQVRVGLGLPKIPPSGDDLGQAPPDLDQNFSAVRQALAELLQSAAPLGIAPKSYNETPREIIAEFYRRDPQGNLDRIYAELIRRAPAIKQAQARLDEAQHDLEQAELNLRYCRVVAEIDGAVTRRNVNPGNNVQVGQSLMAIRSLREIWVDANFKETQLADLRIGQRVLLEVDMYGTRREYQGRISGFTMGTGQTLSLLPPQNATGNFVKIVQRLPVRIDLTNYDPEKAPLFVGLSVVPYVYYKEPPQGPDAGSYLQPLMQLPVGPLDPKQ
jgi:membrane fusion protein (multidrug efflux system)